MGLRSPAGRSPGLAIASRTAGRAVRSGILWGYVFGLTVASAALSFASTYRTAAQRAGMAALFGANAGLAAINGPARQIQTVAGYTVWKSYMFLMLVGAVWGLLIGTRLLRGEEDAGRWELLLAGQTTRRRATAQALGGLAAGLLTMWALTAIILVVVGRSSKVHVAPGAALFFAVALAATPAVFMAAGALASQLAATRRQASAYAGTALGVAYALRMVADSGAGLGWLRALTPLGWAEELRPLTGPQPLLLVPLFGLTAVLGGLAVRLAGSRDLGTSLIPDRTSRRARRRPLSGPMGLSLRLARPALIGWLGGIGAMALLLGLIAKQGGKLLTSSPTIEKVMRRLGEHGGGAASYLSFTFLMVAVMVSLVAASQMAAAREEEAEGRLEHLVVRPVARLAWLAGRAGLVAGVLVVTGLVAGVLAWAGAASDGAHVGIASLLGAGVNVVPPALCVLGAGVLAMGLWPRATTVATYGVIAWSFLIEIAAGIVRSNRWLVDTSVFHQMASSPAVDPDWTSIGVLVAVAVAVSIAGGIAFRRRDLVGA